MRKGEREEETESAKKREKSERARKLSGYFGHGGLKAKIGGGGGK